MHTVEVLPAAWLGTPVHFFVKETHVKVLQIVFAWYTSTPVIEQTKKVAAPGAHA